MKKKKIIIVMSVIIVIFIIALYPSITSSANISFETYFNEIDSEIKSKGNIKVIWEKDSSIDEVDIISDDFKTIANELASIKYYLGDEINNEENKKKENAVLVTNNEGQLSSDIKISNVNTINISTKELDALKKKKSGSNVMVVDISESEENNGNITIKSSDNINDSLELLNNIITKYEKMGWGE